ncbi:MAG TPA: baseplate J/gp47 family protein [Anaerolineaceae bacterium]|nr:baseplate J/gp47 family protein [Anaerolineaceae bacterium]
MKTSVIQLEHHDDVISTRDKIAGSKSARILLVWPERGNILSRKLDLVLLQRFAQNLGGQLALVTIDSEVLFNAKDVGIPVFRNVEEAQKRPWRRPRNRRRVNYLRRERKKVDLEEIRSRVPKKNLDISENQGVRITAFTVGILATVILILFFLPSAQVNVKLAEQEQSLFLGIRANPSITAPDLSGDLPTYLKTVVVEGQDEIASTGQSSLPDKTANGTISMTNLTEQPVDVPLGTVVLTNSNPSIKFQTTQDVLIPAGVGKTATASIQAVQPGISGNMASGEIQAVEGAVGLSVSITNPNATSGGSDQLNSVPTNDDYTALRNKLLHTLSQTAIQEFQNGLKSDETLINATIILNKVQQEICQPAIGQPGDRLNLKLRVEFNGMYYRQEDMQTIANQSLDADLQKGYSPVSGSITISSLSTVTQDGENTRWQIRASRKIRQDWSADYLAQAVAGKTKTEAYQIIQSALKLKSPPVIFLSPGWWSRMPYLTFQIKMAAE